MDNIANSASDARERLHALVKDSKKSFNFSELLEYSKLTADIKNWCADSLASTHLTHVALILKEELQASEREMEFFGLPTDLLDYFPGWKTGNSQEFNPPTTRAKLPKLSAAQGFAMLRLQLSPFSPTLSAALLLVKRLIENLDDSINLSIAVEAGGDLETLYRIISEFGPNASERVSLVELQTTSIFAQDNARGARLPSDQPALLIPRDFRTERDRARESLNSQIGSEYSSLPVVRSNLFWEGGNIVSDNCNCFIGVDHLRENMVRLGLTKEQVIALFQAEFGEQIEFLGNFEETLYNQSGEASFTTGQASFHLDLDLHVLGRLKDNEAPVAIIAAPEIGLQHLDLVLSRQRLVNDHFMSETQAREHIKMEYKSYAEERFEKLKLYRLALEAKGYRVVGVPDLRIDPCGNLFSTRNLDFVYCNVLSGLHKGAPTIFFLPYKVSDLDVLAEQAYREAGCDIVKVSQTGRLANLLMLFSGGIRCACSQLY